MHQEHRLYVCLCCVQANNSTQYFGTRDARSSLLLPKCMVSSFFILLFLSSFARTLSDTRHIATYIFCSLPTNKHDMQLLRIFFFVLSSISTHINVCSIWFFFSHQMLNMWLNEKENPYSVWVFLIHLFHVHSMKLNFFFAVLSISSFSTNGYARPETKTTRIAVRCENWWLCDCCVCNLVLVCSI